MELFFTNTDLVKRIVDGKESPVDSQIGYLFESLSDLSRKEFIPDKMPFFLRSDGSYFTEVNRFFVQLPSDRCPSPNTWRGYALDILAFSRFLDECCGGKTLMQPVKEDMQRYFRFKRMTDGGKVKEVTWNRAVAALEKFYSWAIDEGLIENSPFNYRLRSWMPKIWISEGSPLRNTAYERANSEAEIRFVTIEEYRIFRDVGLLGHLPSGGLDPFFRGRNRLRNAAYAEFAVTTGTRLEEQTSLLIHELPNPDDAKWKGRNSCKMRLAAPITKGNSGRSIWLPKRVLKQYIHSYILEEREGIAGQAFDAGEYDNANAAVLIKSWGFDSCVEVAGGTNSRLSYETMNTATRLKLYDNVDGQNSAPGVLWLSEAGQPIRMNSVEMVFRRASLRCQRFGYRIWITPHVLRHTFAVAMLTNLIREVLKWGLPKNSETGSRAYRKVIADPLRTLQVMMGHASITTTYKYLTYIEEVEEIIDAAIGGWSEHLEFETELSR